MADLSIQNRGIDRRQQNIPVANERRSGQDRRNNNQEAIKAIEVIPMGRRALPITDAINQGQIIPALGMASVALINLPEDCRDLHSAYKQLKGVEPSYNYTKYQHPFSFFRGTAIEKWLHKQIDKGNNVAQWLFKNDKTLADSIIGKKILKLLGTEIESVTETKVKDFQGNYLHAYSYSGNCFKRLTSRALLRTTFLGVCVTALLQIPKILKSDHKIKQTAKSAVNIGSITAGIGYGGAIGATFGGPAGSLIGMGAGAVLGNKLSEKLV